LALMLQSVLRDSTTIEGEWQIRAIPWQYEQECFIC
jgi:hypothetical protein